MIRMFYVLFLTLFMSTAFAQKQVSIVWPFSMGSTQSGYLRASNLQANTNQSEYFFVLENKPGAQGEIAAHDVLNENRQIHLLATGAAFFVRPFLYSQTRYNFDQFRVVHIIGYSPYALISKEKTLAQIMEQKRITIGVGGTGLMAQYIKKAWPGREIEVVQFKSGQEALMATLGGHIDMSLEFLGEAKIKKLNVVGISGSKKIEDYPLLKDFGLPELANQNGIYLILAKKSMPDSEVLKFRNLLIEAEKSEEVQRLYKLDYIEKPKNLKTENDYTRWYLETIKNYERATAGLKVE